MSIHLLRGLFLVVSLVALAVAYLWFFNPGAVNSIEKKIKERYISSYEMPFRKAEEKLDSGDAAGGLRLMERHFENLDWVKKTDQLSSHKRRVYKRLISEYQELGNQAGALRFYDSLLQFDDRDLDSALDRASLLLDIPERRAEGEAAIAEIFRLAPTGPVSKKFLAVSLEKGDLTGAIRALYSQSRATAASASGGKGRWQVYWNVGDGFSKKRTWKGAPKLLDDGTLVLSVELPKENEKLTGFRIDPPRSSYTGMRDISTTFRSGDRRIVLDSQAVNYSLRRIESRCGVLFPHGRDPFMYFAMPEQISLAETIEVQFVARLQPGVPKPVADLIGESALLETTLQALRSAGNPGPHDFLVSLLNQRSLLSPECPRQ